MATIFLKPERIAQLEEYARRRGMDTASALDEALADYLEWEAEDSREAVERIHRGYADVKAGRTRSAAEPFGEDRYASAQAGWEEVDHRQRGVPQR